MKYDFSALEEKFQKSGLTYQEWSKKTRPRVHFASIGRILKRGRAHQKTAKALIAVFGIPYEAIVPRPARKPKPAA